MPPSCSAPKTSGRRSRRSGTRSRGTGGGGPRRRKVPPGSCPRQTVRRVRRRLNPRQHPEGEKRCRDDGHDPYSAGHFLHSMTLARVRDERPVTGGSPGRRKPVPCSCPRGRGQGTQRETSHPETRKRCLFHHTFVREELPCARMEVRKRIRGHLPDRLFRRQRRRPLPHGEQLGLVVEDRRKDLMETVRRAGVHHLEGGRDSDGFDVKIDSW